VPANLTAHLPSLSDAPSNSVFKGDAIVNFTDQLLRVSRRRMLVLTGVAAGTGLLAPFGAAQAETPTLAGLQPTSEPAPVSIPAMVASSGPEWQRFDQAVQAAMQTFGMVGAAVGVVTAEGTLHSQTFGVRNRDSGAPVTPDTLFRVGSATKSMTAALVASFVDDGTLSWDQPVIEVWPDFRAPTDELTKTLRMRDLMGMATGLGESASVGLHYDYPSALEVMQGMAYLPVLTPPDTEWYYNNAVYAVAGYLAPIRQGVALDQLQSTYARLMQERVFGPVGMTTARLADDPRPYTDDYARGYAPDFVDGTAAEPWVPIGAFAPVGAALASVSDMAAHVRLQLRHGISPSGVPVVSAANLAECWKPHIAVPIEQLDGANPVPLEGPDFTSGRYAMGWIDYAYTGGRHLIFHTGFWDGFGAFIGFFPDDNLGLVVLANVGFRASKSFYRYVLNLLLENRFGLNHGANDTVVAAYQDATAALTAQAAQARAVDAGTITPFLGGYEHGYGLAFDAAGALRLHMGGRAVRVLALPDGGCVAASGTTLVGTPIHLLRDDLGAPVLELQDAETVRWLRGPD
jgi:CubicO group peptidase (beta-lactamase class C family)